MKYIKKIMFESSFVNRNQKMECTANTVYTSFPIFLPLPHIWAWALRCFQLRPGGFQHHLTLREIGRTIRSKRSGDGPSSTILETIAFLKQ